MLLNSIIHQSLKRLKAEIRICVKYQHTAAAKTDSNVSPNLNNVQPVFRYVKNYPDKYILQDEHGEYVFKSLFCSSVKLSKKINEIIGHKPNERIVYLCPNDSSNVITQWAIWMAGQIAVPLSKHHPPNMLEYFVKDSDASLIITTSNHEETIADLSRKVEVPMLIFDKKLIEEATELKKDVPDSLLDAGLDPKHYESGDALIIYTSGTTGPPKGVVLTHKNLHAQVKSMVECWNWTKSDAILHTLPLHHVHGVINALITPMSVGAKVYMLPEFKANEVWSYLLGIKKIPKRINVFMGVPTMYSKLIQEYDELFKSNKRQAEFIKNTLSQKMRLMVSGSAPLQVPVLKKWEEISGHVLLERYGMSETGMVLSNPLVGERKPGFVGQPMPYVSVRITAKDKPEEVLVEGDSNGSKVVAGKDEKPISGDLLVKGPNVFRAYFNKPKATAKTFAPEDWFITGDVAEYVDGYYKILGRSSADIIKSGGYKISALQIESVLLNHDHITDVAVVGLPDVTWGEKVTAIVVLKEEKTLTLAELREWCKSHLPSYSIPTDLRIVKAIERNAMGKINKKELKATLLQQEKKMR